MVVVEYMCTVSDITNVPLTTIDRHGNGSHNRHNRCLLQTQIHIERSEIDHAGNYQQNTHAQRNREKSARFALDRQTHSINETLSKMRHANQSHAPQVRHAAENHEQTHTRARANTTYYRTIRWQATTSKRRKHATNARATAKICSHSDTETPTEYEFIFNRTQN